jgi:hypothetical protein
MGRPLRLRGNRGQVLDDCEAGTALVWCMDACQMQNSGALLDAMPGTCHAKNFETLVEKCALAGLLPEGCAVCVTNTRIDKVTRHVETIY